MRSLSETYEKEELTGYNAFIQIPDLECSHIGLMNICDELEYLEKQGGHYFTLWSLIKCTATQLCASDRSSLFREMMFRFYILKSALEKK